MPTDPALVRSGIGAPGSEVGEVHICRPGLKTRSHCRKRVGLAELNSTGSKFEDWFPRRQSSKLRPELAQARNGLAPPNSPFNGPLRGRRKALLYAVRAVGCAWAARAPDNHSVGAATQRKEPPI